MHTTILRKVGDLMMIELPPDIVEKLHLRPGAKVRLAVQNGRLVVEPQQRLRFTLDQLLTQCNPNTRRSKEEREWLASKPAGRELI
jgi:antitoxin ChpS